MRRVLILGGGKIGSLIATLLVESGEYEVHLGDVDKDALKQLQSELGKPQFHVHSVDVMDKKGMESFLSNTPVDGLISSLPYYCNLAVGELARAHSCTISI